MGNDDEKITPFVRDPETSQAIRKIFEAESRKSRGKRLDENTQYENTQHENTQYCVEKWGYDVVRAEGHLYRAPKMHLKKDFLNQLRLISDTGFDLKGLIKILSKFGEISNVPDKAINKMTLDQLRNLYGEVNHKIKKDYMSDSGPLPS